MSVEISNVRVLPAIDRKMVLGEISLRSGGLSARMSECTAKEAWGSSFFPLTQVAFPNEMVDEASGFHFVGEQSEVEREIVRASVGLLAGDGHRISPRQKRAATWRAKHVRIMAIQANSLVCQLLQPWCGALWIVDRRVIPARIVDEHRDNVFRRSSGGGDANDEKDPAHWSPTIAISRHFC